MKEFLGFGGYTREPEGAYSWQHLLFVGSLLAIMTVLAIVLGRRNRSKTLAQKNKVIIASAILINAFEIFKIAVLCLRAEGGPSFEPILRSLPLFLCSIQLIAIPLAAFTKGRIEEAALDFVSIFGLLGAVFGTIGAAQNYNAYPVLSMDNVVSGITHCISGFAALYIMISGMERMRKKNMIITYGILILFCVAAYIANVLIPYNYMFLMAGDGTPYDILYNLVNGNRVLYPLTVVGLFLIYIFGFYSIFHLIVDKHKEKETVSV